MNRIINYLLRFLLGVERASAYCGMIGYTSNPNFFKRYKLVIIPSRFFDADIYGTADSLPRLPLVEIEGVPILFGSARQDEMEGTRIVYADIIASAYFLMTRYEEIQHRDIRDEHGRFPGRESLPFKAGFIHRPVIEEYGQLLRRWLRQTGVEIEEPKPMFRKIWLTHDVDAPFFCRSVRNVLRETFRGSGFVQACKYFAGPLRRDPYYTFPWMLKQDQAVKEVYKDGRCEVVYFLKAGGHGKYDRPHYWLRSPDVHALLELLKSKQVSFGLHTSYHAGEQPSLIASEKETLDHVWNLGPVSMNRHHYLSLREPEDFDKLIRAGITDDFTMGYADVSGFRLGTCRPVKWINPITRQMTSLTLHPLALMDSSLSDPKYMGLDAQEALSYSQALLHTIYLHGGEAVLLWHNTSFSSRAPQHYHRQLYMDLLETILSKK